MIRLLTHPAHKYTPNQVNFKAKLEIGKNAKKFLEQRLGWKAPHFKELQDTFESDTKEIPNRTVTLDSANISLSVKIDDSRPTTACKLNSFIHKTKEDRNEILEKSTNTLLEQLELELLFDVDSCQKTIDPNIGGWTIGELYPVVLPSKFNKGN